MQAADHRLLALALCLAATAAPATSQRPSPAAPETWRTAPDQVIQSYLQLAAIEPIEVLLLGTFHFDDQGLDEYKPTHRFDALAEDRQAQIATVVDALVKFAPDVICVERKPNTQQRLDQSFASFRDGGLRDRKNEIVQIAFATAQRLQHERVHAIDAPGRWLEPRANPMQWAKQNDRLAQLGTPMMRVAARYAHDKDRFIDREHLTTILRYMNHPRVLQISHAQYLVGTVHAADGEQYPGPDGFASQWFNRNLRIFANVRRVAKPGQRVVVVIGAGHVPILRHCVTCSPEFRLVEVADVLPAAKHE